MFPYGDYLFILTCPVLITSVRWLWQAVLRTLEFVYTTNGACYASRYTNPNHNMQILGGPHSFLPQCLLSNWVVLACISHLYLTSIFPPSSMLRLFIPFGAYSLRIFISCVFEFLDVVNRSILSLPTLF